ncbi:MULTISPECIES: amino acid ABC transporter permease [Bradyrhizobium]|jgi:glutamate/aspartate transport system permease protein|uniref:Glutamate/aspartate transport system permease protein n=1 Tax=Bradyrhizobium elkanii TaxID=29448 RepID=A0ABV4ETX8_BRAEL|nr:amino acid ABC transporter permease [Bradyrhizobium elkanii]MCP1755624.1 glutamate/aspartate transport system permease protein [Bradyrhizobium elkanii]MCP1981140.1 glutamate/aspartate transport system permease protein [Bradyrhizobium elkanii]MCS3689309.1 glutamate/aspartate transport system permease protein [Bradyrhizobium elkanii]MCS3884082.1 glutamate/aspartate transport system permease protein [Bradyrhizobium elkanii]MCS4216890.1 glutamate/aspartate transport system permease protein [Bra
MNSFDFSIIVQAWPYLWSGLLFSLSLTAAAFLVGMFLGTLFALVQHFELRILSQLVRSYVALMRSIPLILVLFWFFFLVPIVLGHLSGGGRPIPVGATYTAFITFGLFEAAYYSEIIRVGLRAVNKGQFEACQALALSTFDTYRHVVLPQVFRVASPIILSQTIILFQDTSLVYVLSLTDLLGAASKLAQLNGRLVEMYLAVAVVYLIISSAASQFVALLRKNFAIAGAHR